MVRVGFRTWLAFLLVAWGCVATSFMFITSPTGFYVCRLLLGAFECGAFPAMWFALSVFFPRKRYGGVGASLARVGGCPACVAGRASHDAHSAARAPCTSSPALTCLTRGVRAPSPALPPG